MNIQHLSKTYYHTKFQNTTLHIKWNCNCSHHRRSRHCCLHISVGDGKKFSSTNVGWTV